MKETTGWQIALVIIVLIVVAGFVRSCEIVCQGDKNCRMNNVDLNP